MTLINKFLHIVDAKKEDVAIKTKNQEHTYGNLYHDILKLTSSFEKMNLEENAKVLLLVNMSYEMYVGILACILYGLDVVIIDNFKDIKRVNTQLEEVRVDLALVNTKTAFLKNVFKPLRKVKKLNIKKKIKQNEPSSLPKNRNRSSLITFTSGGTGAPKAVRRSLEDLEKQLNLTLEATGDLSNEYVLATLPVYTLACLIEGIKVYLPSKKEDLNTILNTEENTVMFSSITNYLKIKDAKHLKRAFFGGSILYYHEAKYIKENLPNANITYIYGATEASIISTTSLDEYLKNLEEDTLCLGRVFKGNIVQTIEEEIIVSQGIITNNYLNEEAHSHHHTKDLGYVKDNQVYLVGRKVSDDICSNYLLEMIVKKSFKDFFPLAVLNIKGEYHLYLEEKDASKRLDIISILEQHITNATIHIVKKLPLDYRHHAKIDYKKLLKMNNGDKYV